MDIDAESDEISNFWRLAEEFTVREAALLLIGIDPASMEGGFGEEGMERKRSRDYEAAKQALSGAIRKGTLSGHHVPMFQYDVNRDESRALDGTTDINSSKVDRDSLVHWLASRGVSTGFFFPPGVSGTPDFLNPLNPRYAPKLAAAVSAWQAVTDAGKKSPKQALEKWLREHAADFRLTDEEGNPVAAAIEECSQVANWNPKGGAPKTPG